MDATRLTAGALGGLVGGVLFGLLMQVGGMIGMVAGLVGADGAAIGWLVHLAISVALGIGFTLLPVPLQAGTGTVVAAGAAYGVAWWVLGALLAMPLVMGMPVLQVGGMQLMSLLGHIVYGVALAGVARAVQAGATSSDAAQHA